MSALGSVLSFEAEGVGRWSVLELTQKTPAERSPPPALSILNPARFDLSWREEAGVLYMDARPVGYEVLPPLPREGGPAELEVLLPVGVQDLAVLVNRPSFEYTLRHEPEGVLLAGRAIAVALACACPKGGVPGASCTQARLYLVVVE